MALVLMREEKPRLSASVKQSMLADLNELIAFCPKCKILTTLWITNEGLTPTRKFSQVGDQIYHDCGSSEPCRLYALYE